MSHTADRCPAAETLAAFAEGNLPRGHAASIVRHLAMCEACFHIVGEVAALNRTAVTVSHRSSRDTPTWRIAAAVAFAAVTGVLIAIWWQRRDPMNRLIGAASALKTRTTAARLTGFSYLPRLTVRSATEDLSDPKFQAIVAAVAATKGTDAEDLHARGVAMLMRLRAADAVDLLRRALQSKPADAGLWSDLAAAQFENAFVDAGIDSQELIRSLNSADRALIIDQSHPEALFNRALALDTLLLSLPARDAWRDYMRVDGTSGWHDEARVRVQQLGAPTTTALWKETISRLETAASAGDTARIEAIVTAFRQQARTWSELIFLHDWAVAASTGDEAGAGRRLKMVLLIARALQRQSGESLLLHSTMAIHRADPPARRALIEGHTRYFEGRVLHRDGRTVDAAPLFEQAVRDFRRGGSPMAFVAQYYLAICRHAAGDNAGSLALAGEILSRATFNHKAIRAQALWQRGTDLSRAGLLLESLDAYARAMRLFEELGEVANAEMMRHNIAAGEAALGRDGVAWRMRRQVFAGLSRNGDPIGLQTSIEAAARTEAVAGRWDSAHALLKIAAHPDLQVNTRLRVNSLWWRALAAYRLGWPNAAAADLAEAQRVLNRQPGGSSRAESENDLRFAEAVIVRAQDPARAVALLDQYIAGATSVQNMVLIPEALLERAMAHEALRHDAESIRDLRECLDRLEQRRGGPEEFRDAFFTTADAAARRLVDLLDRHGRVAEAFAVTDRTRGRSIEGRFRQTASPPFAIDALQKKVPAKTVLVAYAALPDRLLIFSLDAHGLQIARVTVRDIALAREARAFVDAVRSARDYDSRKSGEALYTLLIAPIRTLIPNEGTLVVVNDPLLEALPFAALRDPRGGRYVVEDMAVIVAPSAAVFAALRDQPRLPVSTSILAVGNPSIDRARLGSLADLPDAEMEARQIGALYPDAIVLTGPEANKDSISELLTTSTVVDIAAHAVTFAGDPTRSFLALAPSSRSSGALYLHEVAGMTLPATQMVVLAGCRTSAPNGKNDISSFALAFMSAGARNVVGSLWEVDDAATRVFSTAFHQRLRSGVPTSAALREVQLAMLRSSVPELRHPRAWSAFQLTGSN